MQEVDEIILDNKSFDKFIEIIENPPEPNEALIAANKRRKESIENGDITKG